MVQSTLKMKFITVKINAHPKMQAGLSADYVIMCTRRRG